MILFIYYYYFFTVALKRLTVLYPTVLLPRLYSLPLKENRRILRDVKKMDSLASMRREDYDELIAESCSGNHVFIFSSLCDKQSINAVNYCRTVYDDNVVSLSSITRTVYGLSTTHRFGRWSSPNDAIIVARWETLTRIQERLNAPISHPMRTVIARYCLDCAAGRRFGIIVGISEIRSYMLIVQYESEDTSRNILDGFYSFSFQKKKIFFERNKLWTKADHQQLLEDCKNILPWGIFSSRSDYCTVEPLFTYLIGQKWLYLLKKVLKLRYGFPDLRVKWFNWSMTFPKKLREFVKPLDLHVKFPISTYT